MSITESGLVWLDWVMIAAYVVGVLGLGWYYSKKQKNTNEYFVGTGKMNPIHVATGVRKLDLSDVDWTCDDALGDPSKHLKPEVIQDMKEKKMTYYLKKI